MNIEGTKPERVIESDLGNGYATYALVGGQWCSVNLDKSTNTISDVRWTATAKERDQIVSILTRRLNVYE